MIFNDRSMSILLLKFRLMAVWRAVGPMLLLGGDRVMINMANLT